MHTLGVFTKPCIIAPEVYTVFKKCKLERAECATLTVVDQSERTKLIHHTIVKIMGILFEAKVNYLLVVYFEVKNSLTGMFFQYVTG